jgi:hypothetical protein
VRDIRQTPINKVRLDKLMSKNYNEWDDETAKTGFSRNQVLIDLSFIPEDIKEKIINTYEETKPAARSNLLEYFISKKLRNLMDVIEEF